MVPRARRVFTTQAKDNRTEPLATALTNAFARRRPTMPFTRNPSSGKVGMSQRCCIALVLHRVHFVHIEGVAILEYGEDDGQSHGGFRGRYYHYEECEQVAIHLFELVGEGDEAEVYGVQHELDRHENRDDIAAEEK